MRRVRQRAIRRLLTIALGRAPSVGHLRSARRAYSHGRSLPITPNKQTVIEVGRRYAGSVKGIRFVRLSCGHLYGVPSGRRVVEIGSRIACPVCHRTIAGAAKTGGGR